MFCVVWHCQRGRQLRQLRAVRQLKAGVTRKCKSRGRINFTYVLLKHLELPPPFPSFAYILVSDSGELPGTPYDLCPTAVQASVRACRRRISARERRFPDAR